MAIIKQTRIWNGVRTRVDVNTETGATYVYAPGAGTLGVDALMFTSEGKSRDWKVQNPQTVTNLFNSANNKQSSLEEVENAFLTEGYKIFDNDRAAVLNNSSNYSSPEEATSRQSAFFANLLPRIVDPQSKITVNEDGSNPIALTVIPFDQNLPDFSFDSENFPVLVDSGLELGLDLGFDLNTSILNPGGTSETSELPDDILKIFVTGERPNPSSSFGELRYPLNDPFKLDYIKIDVIGYVPSLPSGESFLGSGSQSATKRFQNSTKKGTIFLPMQPALSETSSIDWGADSLNAFFAVLGKGAMGFMDAAGTSKSIEELISKSAETLRGLGIDANKILNDDQLKGFVKAFFAGKIVGSNIVGRTAGTVVNPNLELLFNGPRLRQFNFNFKLTPREKEEAEVIKKIIFMLKKHSAPKKEGSGLFLKFPDIFQLEYVYQGNGQHPFMHKFKPCALTNLSVDYTPDGSYMTYGENGSMTAYNLSLSFGEIEPNYEDEYDSPSDMGF